MAQRLMGLQTTTIGTFWEHTCATTDEGLMCWGANFWGNLGNGTEHDGALPSLVAWPNEN